MSNSAGASASTPQQFHPSIVPPNHHEEEPTAPGSSPLPEIRYVVEPVTVDLKESTLLRVITGGYIASRYKAMKLSRRKHDPLPVHRGNNGMKGDYYIVITEYREWALRQELI